MSLNDAGNVRKRKTVIYKSLRPSSMDTGFRDSLTLLDKILASYERTVEGLTRVLLPPEDMEEEEVRNLRAP